VDLDKLQELIHIFEDSDLAEIEVEEDGRRVRLRKHRPETETVAQPAITVNPPPPAAYQVAAPPPQPVVGPTPPEPEPEANGVTTIDSPMVGVFYAAPAPGKPPFVKPGDKVAKDKTLCIVEAMKLMNEVTAKSAVEIVRVLVENGEPVEFGQPLFSVRPLE
jgi:acetyl-CoA carboxylase biotin carboxyl carrier protein